VILRRATVVIAFLLLAALTAARASAHVTDLAGFTPPALRGTPQFFVTGHGWGHGVGMSQYGAYGFAQNGYTYDEILEHYYPGTELGPTTIKSIRVLLASAKSLTISSTGPWKLKDATAASTTLAAGKVTLRPDLTFKLPGATEPLAFTGPLTFTASSAAAPLVFKKPYRGTFTVTSDGKKLMLVNTVPLEQYLYGVVPSEMPSTWLRDALEAQAVAARSYALAKRKKTGPFDVYPDTRDQVYGGLNAEKPSTSAAVDATAGRVLTYDGKIATTYFFSTSGGRTAAIEDVWKSPPVPYLVSVDDPYDSISPYHDWGPIELTAAKMKKALKVPGRLLDLQTTSNPSGRVAEATAVGVAGDRTLTAAQVQKALGLRSTWFSVGVLALDPLPATTVTFGSPVLLTGLGRGLDDAMLESRTPGTTSWTPVRPLAAGADGSFAVAIKAAAPAEYRASSGGAATPTTTLVVAPKVNLKIAGGWTGFAGAVRPKLKDAPVQVQALGASGAWSTLARTTVTATGSFAATLPVSPGTYRARVAVGHGWAVAVSPRVVAG
jgi:stage II sporulation protein D